MLPEENLKQSGLYNLRNEFFKLQENPGCSTRIGKAERVYHMTVQRVLYKNSLYSYGLQRTQAISHEVSTVQLAFSVCFLNKCIEDSLSILVKCSQLLLLHWMLVLKKEKRCRKSG